MRSSGDGNRILLITKVRGVNRSEREKDKKKDRLRQGGREGQRRRQKGRGREREKLRQSLLPDPRTVEAPGMFTAGEAVHARKPSGRKSASGIYGAENGFSTLMLGYQRF